MGIRTFALPIALCFVCQCVGVAKEGSIPSSNKNAGPPPRPTIRFLRPVRDERFFDVPIYLQVQVSDFHLVEPEALGSGTKAPNTGHIQYSMDDYPVCATSDTQIMLGKNLGNGYLPVGFHVLKAQLVDVNGKPLDPPMVAVTNIFSEHPAAVEVVHSPNGSQQAELVVQQLYQLRVHLQELQKDLSKIQTGNFGYSPTPITGNVQGAE